MTYISFSENLLFKWKKRHYVTNQKRPPSSNMLKITLVYTILMLQNLYNIHSTQISTQMYKHKSHII